MVFTFLMDVNNFKRQVKFNHYPICEQIKLFLEQNDRHFLNQVIDLYYLWLESVWLSLRFAENITFCSFFVRISPFKICGFHLIDCRRKNISLIQLIFIWISLDSLDPLGNIPLSAYDIQPILHPTVIVWFEEMNR